MSSTNDDVVIRRVKNMPEDVEDIKPKSSSKKKTVEKKELSKKDAFLQQYNRHIKVLSVLMIVFAILILLALVSYTQRDEANTQITIGDILALLKGREEAVARAQTTSNWLGLLGAVISNFLLNHTIGYIVLIIPVIAIIWSLSLFIKVKVSAKLIKSTIILLISAVLFSSLMGSLSKTAWFISMSKEWPGSTGLYISSFLNGIIGKAGSIILLLTGLILTIILVFKIRVLTILGNIREYFGKIFNKIREQKAKSLALKKNKEKNQTTKKAVSIDAEESNELDEPARIFRRNSELEAETVANNANEEDINPLKNPLKAFSKSLKKKGADKEKIDDSPKEYANNFERFQDEAATKPNITINKKVIQEDEFIPQSKYVTPVIEKPVFTEENFRENNYQPKDLKEINELNVFNEGNDLNDMNVSKEINYTKDLNVVSVPSVLLGKEPIPDFEKSEEIEEFAGDFEENETIPSDIPNKKILVTVNELVVKKHNGPVNLLSTNVLDEEIDYKPPTLNLLVDDDDKFLINEDELKTNARILQEKLETFKIYIENLSVTPGPVVTQYEFVPSAGIKISRIAALSDDIAMALKAKGIRIIAPVPGKGTVGIEIPNANPSMVRFSSCVKSSKFHNMNLKLPLAFGKTISGDVFTADLSRMPHLLIAGATGSGKSVGINSIITSLLFKIHPRNLKFVIIDPKKVELRQYKALENHFLAASPDIDNIIITAPEEAVIVLKAVCAEMDLRYDIMARVGQRNIADYNKKISEGKFKDDKEVIHKNMPYIVVIIDELADLMLTASKEVETPIIRIAQLARAVGIHLVVATQRPSVDVITGIIKANFPSRISYLVASRIDSRTVLDTMGAEKLLGNGDMLFQAGGSPPMRVQNAFLSTEEVEDICSFIGKQKGYSEPYMLPSILETKEGIGVAREDRDTFFEEAARLVIRHQQASVSLIQRRLKVGYARAGRIVDELESMGVVGPYDGSKARSVLLESESDLEAIL